jgi:hypothetical protein
MTGLCQRPIVHNRTRPVVLGAYWTMIGRCLHRVRSCDHRVRSSREKRISPIFNRTSGSRVFPPSSQSTANLAMTSSAALLPSRRTTAVPSLPCPQPRHPRPCPRRASVPRLHAREPAAHSPAPPHHRSRPAPPSSTPPEQPRAPPRLSTTAVSLNTLPSSAPPLRGPRPLPRET